jgi:hypothetical protein
MKRMVWFAIAALAFAAAAAQTLPIDREALRSLIANPADSWEKRPGGGGLTGNADALKPSPLPCAECHREIAASYARTPMARSSGVVIAAVEPAGEVNRLRIMPRGNTLELQGAGRVKILAAYIGSRRAGRSYLFREGGQLRQAPVAFYAGHGWDWAPGYSQPDFTRAIGAECLFCHSSRGEPRGIGCERCHGDAADHKNLVNPAKLPAERQDAVCEQCHLAGEVRLARAGKDLSDFRPGESLAAYLEVLIRPAGPEGLRVNGHAESLAVSHCRLRAGNRIRCGTCHPVHGAARTYQEMCVSCHQRPHRDDNCIPCHMQKARAFDGGHAAFTDHTILNFGVQPSQRPGPPARLISYYRGERVTGRDLGLAYSELAIRYQDPQWIEKAWPLLREAASRDPGDAVLQARIRKILEAAARARP